MRTILWRVVAALALTPVVLATLVGCEPIRLADAWIASGLDEPRTDDALERRDPGRLDEGRQQALDDLIEDLSDPAHEPTGNVVLRLSINGGWGLPDSDELHLSVEDGGRVVRVTDTSVYSATQDYTSLRLSDAGIVRLLATLRPLLATRADGLDGGAGVSSTDRSAWLEIGDRMAFSMDRIGQEDGYGREQRAQRAAFLQAIDRIRDLDWLGSDIIEPEAPWIPDTMTVLARSVGPEGDTGAGPSAIRWPLDRTIEDLASGTQRDPDGGESLVVCLAGEEVAPVFGLLTGVNRAYLGVDDGKPWELNVRPHYPGYRLAGDPCQPID